VLLVSRGEGAPKGSGEPGSSSCTFAHKAHVAQARGYGALVIFNDAQFDVARINSGGGWRGPAVVYTPFNGGSYGLVRMVAAQSAESGNCSGVHIPSLFISHESGESLQHMLLVAAHVRSGRTSRLNESKAHYPEHDDDASAGPTKYQLSPTALPASFSAVQLSRSGYIPLRVARKLLPQGDYALWERIPSIEVLLEGEAVSADLAAITLLSIFGLCLSMSAAAVIFSSVFEALGEQRRDLQQQDDQQSGVSDQHHNRHPEQRGRRTAGRYFGARRGPFGSGVLTADEAAELVVVTPLEDEVDRMELGT